MASSLFQNQNSLKQVNSQVLNRAKSMMNNMGEVKNIMSMLQGKGMNAEQMVRNICKQQGIDVDELMKLLKQEFANSHKLKLMKGDSL